VKKFFFSLSLQFIFLKLPKEGAQDVHPCQARNAGMRFQRDDSFFARRFFLFTKKEMPTC